MDNKENEKKYGTDKDVQQPGQRKGVGQVDEQIGTPEERHGSREGFGQQGNLGEGKTVK